MSNLKKKSSSNKLKFYGQTFVEGDILTKLSFIIMGLSNILRGQIIKGFIFLFSEFGFIFYMYAFGVTAFSELKELGTKKQGMVFDETKGFDVMQAGDNSMMLLLAGVIAAFIIVTFFFVWNANIKSAIEAQRIKNSGEKLPSFIDDIKAHFDSKLHKTLLFFPMAGIIIFNILPTVFMILIAFTNFDRYHQPPGNLFTWVGLNNFKTLLLSGQTISKTFWPVLGWTLIWAVFATGLNFIGGMLLAMLINKKGVKFKPFWRAMFVLSIAVPQFVSLLVMKNLLADRGALNVLLESLGLIDTYIPFLTETMHARITIILVNVWVGVPYTMLITTGILMNIPEDLYESARVDGAPPLLMFVKITLPYVLFVTGPYLITQFVGNINNFNVIYFLTAGNPATLDYYQAGKTDLLVTWLYKLSTTAKDYNYAATVGILIFVISAVFSLLAYSRTSAVQNEEDFQ